MPAQTLRGLIAKARVAQAASGQSESTRDLPMDGPAAESLIYDLLRLGEREGKVA